LAASAEEDALHQRAAHHHHHQHQHHNQLEHQAKKAEDNIQAASREGGGSPHTPPRSDSPAAKLRATTSGINNSGMSSGAVSSTDLLATAPHAAGTIINERMNNNSNGNGVVGGVTRSDTPPTTADTPLLLPSSVVGHHRTVRSSSADCTNTTGGTPTPVGVALPGTPSDNNVGASVTATPTQLMIGSNINVRGNSTNSPVGSHMRMATSFTPTAAASIRITSPSNPPPTRTITTFEPPLPTVSSHDVVSSGQAETLLLPRQHNGTVTGSHGNASLTDAQITLEVVLAHPVCVEVFKDRVTSLHSSETLQFYLEVTTGSLKKIKSEINTLVIE
jgi:hypothetical protein